MHLLKYSKWTKYANPRRGKISNIHAVLFSLVRFFIRWGYWRVTFPAWSYQATCWFFTSFSFLDQFSSTSGNFQLISSHLSYFYCHWSHWSQPFTEGYSVVFENNGIRFTVNCNEHHGMSVRGNTEIHAFLPLAKLTRLQLFERFCSTGFALSLWCVLYFIWKLKQNLSCCIVVQGSGCKMLLKFSECWGWLGYKGEDWITTTILCKWAFLINSGK